MTLPTSFEVTQELACQLVELIVWYDSMPECVGDGAGDRFHENIWELKYQLFSDSQLTLPEDMYIIDIGYREDTCQLYATLGTDNNNDLDEEIDIPIKVEK